MRLIGYFLTVHSAKAWYDHDYLDTPEVAEISMSWPVWCLLMFKTTICKAM